MAECLFCKIVHGEIPADIVFEDDAVIAFRDINPQAPQHLLVIPKVHIENLNDLDERDREIASKVLLGAHEVAAQLDLAEAGWRLVVNNGAGAGQEVFHLHLHLLAGRPFTWPPG